MAELDFGNRFCIDTCSLINLKNLYPVTVFPTLWKNIENQIENSLLISPMEVYNEINRGDDALLIWAKRVKNKLFVELNDEQFKIAQSVGHRFPKLIDILKTIPDADPFVIALAQSMGCTVVTDEKKTNPNKIPSVCHEMGIQCVSLLEYFNMNKWEF